MSRNITNDSSGSGYRGLRDYGATSSTSGLFAGSATMSSASSNDVTFAGFSPTEFMSLSENIGQNLLSIQSNRQQLEKILKIIGGPKDTAAIRDKAHQIQTATNTKIMTTKKDLQRLTLVVRHGDNLRKLQVERIASEFQKVVELYSSSQQQIAAKLKGILLINADQDDIEHDQTGNITSSTDYLFHQQQKTVQQSLQFDQSMMKERERRVLEIEADVLDVNEIMRDLLPLVHQQGEAIDSIESGIDNTAADIESGRAELIKAAEYQAKYRRKVAILLLIAVIIGLIVTGIVVSQLRS